MTFLSTLNLLFNFFLLYMSYLYRPWVKALINDNNDYHCLLDTGFNSNILFVTKLSCDEPEKNLVNKMIGPAKEIEVCPLGPHTVILHSDKSKYQLISNLTYYEQVEDNIPVAGLKNAFVIGLAAIVENGIKFKFLDNKVSTILTGDEKIKISITVKNFTLPEVKNNEDWDFIKFEESLPLLGIAYTKVSVAYIELGFKSQISALGILDTGAGVSVISIPMLEKLGIDITEIDKENSNDLIATTSHKIPKKYKPMFIEFKLINNKTKKESEVISTSFIIIPAVKPIIILGCEFFGQYSCTLDFNKLLLTFPSIFESQIYIIPSL